MLMFSLEMFKDPVEYFGLIAGVIVVISFMMKGEIKMRAVNFVGAVLFIIYGFLIGSISVVLLNFILASVQVYKVIKIGKGKNDEKKDGRVYWPH